MKAIKDILNVINEILSTPPATEPKQDRRSFKWYLKSKISGNNLAWVDKEIDWDEAYKDEKDGYTWYFPLKYSYGASQIAGAVKRSLAKGRLETKVDIIDEFSDEPKLRIRFKNNKLERETGVNNLEESFDADPETKLTICISELYELEQKALDEGDTDIAQAIKNTRIYADEVRSELYHNV